MLEVSYTYDSLKAFRVLILGIQQGRTLDVALTHPKLGLHRTEMQVYISQIRQ